jgi:ABC-type nitrate/sulfonate/bicarbonate transport system substrate-binding protein
MHAGKLDPQSGTVEARTGVGTRSRLHTPAVGARFIAPARRQARPPAQTAPRRTILIVALSLLGIAGFIACSPAPAAPTAGLAPRNAPVGAASQPPRAEQQAASAPAAGPLTTFRFVFPGVNFSSLPFHIADAHGLYKRYGIEVETLTMPSVTSVAALVNGDLEAIGSFGSSVKASVAGHPIKVVFATADTQLFDFVTRPEIQRPEQLRGKIVSASEAGGTQDLATLAALTHFGLTEQDVQYLRSRIENQVRLEQLRLGQIDAGRSTRR